MPEPGEADDAAVELDGPVAEAVTSPMIEPGLQLLAALLEVRVRPGGVEAVRRGVGVDPVHLVGVVTARAPKDQPFGRGGGESRFDSDHRPILCRARLAG